jgi:hypothetical protein
VDDNAPVVDSSFRVAGFKIVLELSMKLMGSIGAAVTTLC